MRLKVNELNVDNKYEQFKFEYNQLVKKIENIKKEG